jgi:integrase
MGRAMRLTEAKIRCLTSQGREYKEYFHEPTPAAGIRVYRGGRKVFFLYYRSPTVMSRGKAGEALLRRVWFGCHESGKPAWRKDPDRKERKSRLPFLSLKDFEIEYRKFVGKLAEGIDPQDGPEPEAKAEAQSAVTLEASAWLRDLWPDGYGEGTLSHLLATYFEAARTGTIHQKRLKPRTLNGYTTAARIYILKRLGDWPAPSIAQDQISDLFTEIAKTAPQMVRNVKKVLSGAYEHARATNWRGMRSYPNPTRGMKIAIPKGKRERWLKDDELEILLPGLDRLSDPKARDVYLLILASGCRPGEAAGVMAEEISTVNDEGIWKIRYKVNRDHLVPLVGPIAEILMRRYQEVGGKGALFWPDVDRTQEYPQQLRKATAELKKLTDLQNFRPHDCRRTMRSHIESLGVRREVGEALLNHVKGEVEGTYALYDYWKERKEALALWHSKLAVLSLNAQVSALAA